MSFITAFILLVFGGLSASVLTGKKFGIMMPVTAMLSIFVLYFCGLFTALYAGAIVTFCLLGALILALVVLVSLPTTRSRFLPRLVEEIKNPVLYIFIVVALLLFMMLYKKEPYNNDEFTHWMLVLKSMFRYGNFGNVGDTNTMFNRYEPGSGIFMYLFIFSGSKFWAGGAFAAFDFLLLSTLLPFLELFRKKSSIFFTLSAIFTVGIVVLHKYNVFENLQVDVLLTTIAAGCYATWRTEKTHGFFAFGTLALGIFTMCVVKTSGIAVAIFLLIYVFVEGIFCGKERLKKFFTTPLSYVYLLLPVLALVFVKVSWSLYCNAYVTKLGWASEMSTKSLIDYFFHPNDFQKSVTSNFVRQFFIGPFGFDKSEGSIKQPQLFAFAMYALCAVALGIKTKDWKKPLLKGVAAVVIVVSFAIGLLFQYIFSFAYWESNRLNAYYRYIQTASCLVSLLLWADLIADICAPQAEKSKIGEKKSSLAVFWTSTCVPLLVAVCVVTGLRHVDFAKAASEQLETYSSWINVTERLGDEYNVYYVIPDYAGPSKRYNVPRYYATPTHCSGMNLGGAYIDGRDSNSSYTGDPFNPKMSKEELTAHLVENAYTHLWLAFDNDAFTKKFGSLFPDGKPQAEILYDVQTSENGEVYLTVSETQANG